jgi:thymidylate kinase
MFTVALIGPDGAGKTSVCHALEQELPWPTKYVYMGVGHESANITLPTTWLSSRTAKIRGVKTTYGGRRIEDRYKRRPQGTVRRVLADVKSAVGLANQLAEEWFRQAVVTFHRVRGRTVLLDRHFVADYVLDIVDPPNNTPWRRRIHAYVLKRFYPKPDLVVYLDAPPEVLLQRKHEGTLDSLERMRQEYLQVRDIVPAFAIVDASQTLQNVVADVTTLMREFAAKNERFKAHYASQ